MRLQAFLSPDDRWLAVPLMDGATTNLWAIPTDAGSMRQLTDFGDRAVVIARSVSWSADSQTSTPLSPRAKPTSCCSTA